MNLKKIMDATYNGEQPYDALYEILSSMSMDNVAGAFADCFGANWVEEEFDYVLRVAELEDEYDFGQTAYENLSRVYEYIDLDEAMAHLSINEIEALLDYYGYEADEDEDEKDDDDEGDETLYEDDVCSIDKGEDEYGDLCIKIYNKDTDRGVWQHVTEFSADDFTDSYEALSKYSKNALDEVHKDKISQGGADFLVGLLIREVKDNADIDVVEDLRNAKEEWKELEADEEEDEYDNFDEYFKEVYGYDPQYFEASYYC